MLKSIRPDEVEMGMYVQGFEGSWLSHPFWRPRFVIESTEVLEKLRAAGVMVLIDTGKGRDVAAAAVSPDAVVAPMSSRLDGVVARAINPLSHAATAASVPGRTGMPPRIVAPAAFGRADRARATALAQRSTKAVKALFDDCLHGRAIAGPAVLAVVDDIATTLEQNSAAFVSITRLKAKDDETYTHSVAVCALMIGLARDAGVSPDMLLAMGTAGLLHDIGKVSIDAAILKKQEPLTAEETAALRRHPELGFAMLHEETDMPPLARDVCLHHHERLDGSGYPFGLAGDDVSQAARIAAICDVYDAMTSDRPYRKGMTPAAALAEMEAAADEFDQSLTFRFMRSIGVFPPGKLVRLRSNRLAVVLPSKHADRCPLARVFYSTIDACFLPYEDVVLSDRLNTEQAIAAENAAQWFDVEWPAMAARIIGGKPAMMPARDVASRELT
ncbi:HD-GYP domain-containing protein [Sphingomonas sp. 1P08PE]|uniref:HD-GYP domain-containing protein n=1 Tax=Sphingomonas sp. 1P08PE TaxID=554122 RepID=UPI0039A05187